MSKKVKKIILISVSAVLAVALITTGVIVTAKYFKNYVGDTVISFEEKTALAGDTVKIPFSVIKNHGIWGGQIKINYDSQAMAFVSCANGDVFDECEINSEDGSVNIVVNQTGLDDSKVNGVIATLNFKIKDSAKGGNYKIEFDKMTDFCNKDGEMIEPILKNGEIKVK